MSSLGDEPGRHRWIIEAQGDRLQIRRIDVRIEAIRERSSITRASADELLRRSKAGDALDDVELEVVRSELARAHLSGTEAGRREAITGWSPKSRNNLLRSLASLDMVGHWAMLTLTVPGVWHDLVENPGAFKAARKALRRRWERRFGPDSWSAVWKLEFQRRGAPHAHIGIRLPDGIDLDELRRWAASAWHETLCHPSGSKCSGKACVHLDHLRRGTQLDAEYGQNLREAGAAFASYFAKHGLWSTKEYQHRLPGPRWRGYAGILEVMIEPSAGAEMRAFADHWDNPGRWWGIENIEKAPLVEGEMNGAEVEAARLLARSIFARRTWRYIEHDDSPRPVLVRRTIRSLHGDAGFWLLASAPAEFTPWFLSAVRLIAATPPGVDRARLLASLKEPNARQHPSRKGLHDQRPPEPQDPSEPASSGGGRDGASRPPHAADAAPLGP